MRSAFARAFLPAEILEVLDREPWSGEFWTSGSLVWWQGLSRDEVGCMRGTGTSGVAAQKESTDNMVVRVMKVMAM